MIQMSSFNKNLRKSEENFANKQKLQKPGQIIKYNRWQQRNVPIIHDVVSVKYNKKNEIILHQLFS